MQHFSSECSSSVSNVFFSSFFPSCYLHINITVKPFCISSFHTLALVAWGSCWPRRIELFSTLPGSHNTIMFFMPLLCSSKLLWPDTGLCCFNCQILTFRSVLFSLHMVFPGSQATEPSAPPSLLLTFFFSPLFC